MVVTVYMRCIALTSAVETEYVITLYCATDTQNYCEELLVPPSFSDLRFPIERFK